MVSKEDVKKIALLARLSLSDQEIEKYAEELAKILQYMEKLNELDLKDVEATSHAVEVTNVFRSDAVKPSAVRDEALKQAPARDGDLFRVPRVL